MKIIVTSIDSFRIEAENQADKAILQHIDQGVFKVNMKETGGSADLIPYDGFPAIVFPKKIN